MTNVLPSWLSILTVIVVLWLLILFTLTLFNIPQDCHWHIVGQYRGVDGNYYPNYGC